MFIQNSLQCILLLHTEQSHQLLPILDHKTQHCFEKKKTLQTKILLVNQLTFLSAKTKGSEDSENTFHSFEKSQILPAYGLLT